MRDKILLFLALGCVILILVLSYTFSRINTLKGEKNALKNDLQKREQTIREMEKVNELYLEAAKENEKFRQELADDVSDNLDVRPATYILNQLHKD